MTRRHLGTVAGPIPWEQSLARLAALFTIEELKEIVALIDDNDFPPRESPIPDL